MTTPIVVSRQLQFERKQIDAWIKSKPVSIALTRKTRVTSAAGGVIDSSTTTLLPQQFRLTVFRRRINHQSRLVSEGDAVQLSYVLTGRYNVDISPGDYFTYDGTDYEVSSIQIDRSVRTAAELTVRSVNTYV